MQRLKIIIIGLTAVFVLQAFAQDWEADARRLRPGDTAGAEDATVQNLAGRMKEMLQSVPRSTDRTEADLARPKLRRALERSLGYKRLPWPPDLQARVVSTLRKDGYRIEKIVYQGLPDEWIPAHLYVPDRLQGLAPAVLFYNGHWYPDSKSRPDAQAFCINMARFGFLVLNFETIGQGERGLSSRDHRRTEGLLAGIAQQGFGVYDTQVALAYLLTRPEVDSQRIGMTGASGGGFNTWMNAALDDRIRVAVPVVATCDLYEQAVARIGRDWDPADHCHYIPGLFGYGNNHELLTMSAPKPVLVVSAKDDTSFPIAGAHDVVEYGRGLYKSYGSPERFGYFEDTVEAHGYQIGKREAAYGWFLRWLMSKGDGKPVKEPATQTLPFDSVELRSFPPGENQSSGPAVVKAVRAIVSHLPPEPEKMDLSKVLGSWPAPIAWTAPIASSAKVQRLMAPSESDLRIPAAFMRPEGKLRGLLVTLDDRGKEVCLSDPVVRQAVREGWAVLSVDPRGIGELTTLRKTWIFAISLMEGDNFVWRQSWDLLRAIQGVQAALGATANRVAIYARGPNASLAATYLIGYSARSKELGLSWFVLRDAFTSYHDFIDRPNSLPVSYKLRSPDQDRNAPLDREIPAIFFPFDALRYFDLPLLLKSPNIPGLIVDALDGDWKPKSPVMARELRSGKLEVATGPSSDKEILNFAQTNQAP